MFTHGLEVFAARLPLYGRLRRSEVWRDFAFVNEWRVSWRYSPRDLSGDEVAPFIDAVERVCQWLEANR